jgi:probable F420-dependent oxidoreductase
MDIGVFQTAANRDADAVAVAVHAEMLGFESFWAPDHTIIPVDYSVPYPGGTPDKPEPDYLWQLADPLVLLGLIAGVTSKIKLGTGVLLVPERNAILTAKQVATLDEFSGGRVLFGVGAGWNPEESTILGGDFEHRWTHVKENIAVMKALWTEHAPEFHGKYNDFAPIRCYPKPAQNPHPPVLLGAINNPRSLKRVAEWGDGWIPIVESVDEFKDGVELIKQYCGELGRNPQDLDFTVFGLGDQWTTRADIERIEPAGANRAVVWLQSTRTDALKKELDGLAQAVF